MRWLKMAMFFSGIILITFPIQGMAQVQAELEVNINDPLHTISVFAH